MTKWHKYRDLKPNIKSIIKNKENSHATIKERKSKTHKERLFLLLKKSDESKLSSEELLNTYREFSKLHKSVWVPIDLTEENALIKDVTTIDMLTIEKKIKELKLAIQNDKILWMYIAISKKVLENDEIECKTKVIDIILGDTVLTTPNKALTIPNDLERKSNIWVKVDKIKKCGGVTISGLQIVDSKVNLKETILKSQLKFWCVEKIKKLNV